MLPASEHSQPDATLHARASLMSHAGSSRFPDTPSWIAERVSLPQAPESPGVNRLLFPIPLDPDPSNQLQLPLDLSLGTAENFRDFAVGVAHQLQEHDRPWLIVEARE